MSIRMWRSLREPLIPASGTWGIQRACKSPILLHSLVLSSCQDTTSTTTMSYRGSMEWPDGHRYDGEFVKGKIEGYAACITHLNLFSQPATVSL